MKFNVEYLGIEHPQYFRGVSVESYEYVSVGVGVTPQEAFDDAIEGLVQQDVKLSDQTFEEMKRDFEKQIEGYNEEDDDLPYEFNHYVSIHYTP